MWTIPRGRVLLRFTAVSRLRSGDCLSLFVTVTLQRGAASLFRDPSMTRGGTEGAQAVPSQHHPRVGAGISRTGRLHLCDAIPSTFALIWVGWANCRVLMDVGAVNSPACGRRVNSLGTSLATELIVTDFSGNPSTVLSWGLHVNKAVLCSRIFQGSSSGTCQIWEDRRGDSD